MKKITFNSLAIFLLSWSCSEEVKAPVLTDTAKGRDITHNAINPRSKHYVTSTMRPSIEPRLIRSIGSMLRTMRSDPPL